LKSLCYGFESHRRHHIQEALSSTKSGVRKGFCQDAWFISQRNCASDGDCKAMNVDSRYRRFVSDVVTKPLPPDVLSSSDAKRTATWPALSRIDKTSRGVGGVDVPTL